MENKIEKDSCLDKEATYFDLMREACSKDTEECNKFIDQLDSANDDAYCCCC